ncbi:uncharacterized protein [Zea mays]|nr:uncharacterized protein LOC103626622 [Zea mays]|eukprot:XP_008645248.1 uncharacterized protein LOC103626622 [Zea mays]
MHTQPSSDPPDTSNMKVKLEIPRQQAMASSRSLPRSASELPDPPSPFSSNPAHHPVSIPTTPGLSSSSCSSFGRMRSPPTDSPPITPTKQQGGKPKPTPAAAAAAYYASLWSPRRLMQRCARAFRRSRSRGGVVRTVKDLAEERAAVLAASSKVSDAASAVPPLPPGVETASSNGARGGSVEDKQRQRHDDCHPEVVPEKIIREDAPPVVAETAAATTTTEVEVEVESPKKGAAPVPEPIVVVAAVEDVVADKFVAVVKEAIKKPEMDEKEVAMRRFLGSRVKTAMEPRSEAEQPRRREVARSNDVIEAARTKLMQKRQCSRVKALVGAFETVIDTQKDAAAGRPQHIYRKSA